MGKGKKDSINPADAYRKEQKKKEIKKNKKERQQTRELTTILRDPSKLSEEVKKLEKEVRSNPIDNQLRQRLGQFRGHLAVLMKKQRDEERELQARREELEPASSSAPAAAKPVAEQRDAFSDVASTFVPKPPSGPPPGMPPPVLGVPMNSFTLARPPPPPPGRPPPSRAPPTLREPPRALSVSAA